jgi:hypothetical protein
MARCSRPWAAISITRRLAMFSLYGREIFTYHGCSRSVRVGAMTDLETLKRAWELFGKSTTAVIDVLAMVARDNLEWGGTLEDAIRAFQGCQHYQVSQHRATGKWLVRELA